MKRHLGLCVLAGLLMVTPARAQVPVNSATFVCQQAAAKAVAKFEDKVAKAIEACLLAVTQCNLQIGPANQQCVGKLLVLNAGKCAIGKLSADPSYYGVGSAAARDPLDKSAIGKAFNAFVKGLAARCAPGLGVDYLALEFSNTTPSTIEDVADSLNAPETGAACIGHKRVLATIPSRNTLVAQLRVHPDTLNAPFSLRSMGAPFNECD